MQYGWLLYSCVLRDNSDDNAKQLVKPPGVSFTKAHFYEFCLERINVY